jgi:hypothetical protein
MDAGNLALTWIRSPNRPSRSKSLCQLRYSGPLYTLDAYRILVGRRVGLEKPRHLWEGNVKIYLAPRLKKE